MNFTNSRGAKYGAGLAGHANPHALGRPCTIPGMPPANATQVSKSTMGVVGGLWG